MDQTTITICGAPNRDTLAALCELAINAGLGLVLQPRQAPPTVVDVKALPPKPRKTPKMVQQLLARPVRRVKTTTPEAQPTGMRAAAEARRQAVLGALRRVGDVGLSFGGLFDKVKDALSAAGDHDQQVAALRNALSILQNAGKVKRELGQWIAVA